MSFDTMKDRAKTTVFSSLFFYIFFFYIFCILLKQTFQVHAHKQQISYSVFILFYTYYNVKYFNNDCI